MDATLIVIDSDAELARGRALVDQLMTSDDPVDISRLRAQARLIAAYEEEKWPHRLSSTAEVIRYLMDQHGLTRKDLVPMLGTPSRVSEILGGKKALSMAMVRRLRARFHVPADLLLPPAATPPAASAPDYPMVAPKYAEQRAAFAKKIGLGRSTSANLRRTRAARSDEN